MNHDRPQKNQRIAALLRDGMAAARAGRRSEARRSFEAVLRLEPRHEEALLWRAGVARNPQTALAALARVLEINPRNQRARAGVRAVRRQLAARAAQRSQMPEGERKSPPPPTKAATSEHRLNGLFVGLVMLIMALSCVLGALVLPDASQAVWAAFYPTVTSTASPTATSTPTPTPTASPTATSTPTLAPTHTPLPTPTPAPTLAFAVPPISSAPTEDKWIDIDLSEQHLVAYVGTVPVHVTRVSTGLPYLPTVKGQFHIYRKLSSTLMSGSGYYLPDVPWTMYFHKSYAIHGTYWHNNFGQRMSHGCVNLPTPDAKWLYDWTPEGTLVVIHD